MRLIREKISSDIITMVVVAMFVASWLSDDPRDPFLLQTFCFHGRSTWEGGEWWRLVTGAFLHANILHIFFNLFGLRDVLPAVVKLFGEGRAQAILWLSVVGGAVASGIWRPDQLGVGISGGLFGLIGAYWAAWRTISELSNNPVAAMRASAVGSMVMMNLFLGFTIPMVDNAGHLGGLAVGWILGKFWVLRMLGLRS